MPVLLETPIVRIHKAYADEAATAVTAADPGEPEAWQERALCKQTSPEHFFPEKGGSTREAKAVCASCPVRAECLRYALDHDERFGIWGGMSERDRRRLKRAGAASVDAAPRAAA